MFEELQEGRDFVAPELVAGGGADEEGEERVVDGEGFVVGVGDVVGGEGGGGE